MSPDPATLLGQVTRSQQAALAARGTKANPAYLAVDVDLVAAMLDRAKAAYAEYRAEHGPHPEPSRFVAEHILGLHIDTPPKEA